jgi:hypothetical protein
MIENTGTVRISWVLNALPQLVPASKYVGDWYLDFLVKNIGILSADHCLSNNEQAARVGSLTYPQSGWMVIASADLEQRSLQCSRML